MEVSCISLKNTVKTYIVRLRLDYLVELHFFRFFTKKIARTYNTVQKIYYDPHLSHLIKFSLFVQLPLIRHKRENIRGYSKKKLHYLKNYVESDFDSIFMG